MKFRSWQFVWWWPGKPAFRWREPWGKSAARLGLLHSYVFGWLEIRVWRK